MCANVPNRTAVWPDYSCYPPVHPARSRKETVLNIQISLAPIIALLAGILILAQPRLLNYIVAIYLIIIGLLGLFGGGGFNLR